MAIAVFHALVILAFYASPFILDWKLVAAIVILYYLQLALLGDCILTMWQFKERNRTVSFYGYMLGLLGFHPDEEHIRVVVDYVIPGSMLLIAVIYQLALGHSVPFQVY